MMSAREAFEAARAADSARDLQPSENVGMSPPRPKHEVLAYNEGWSDATRQRQEERHQQEMRKLIIDTLLRCESYSFGDTEDLVADADVLARWVLTGKTPNDE